MAEMFLWMLCLGRSSLDTKVSAPPSSQRNSMGQQSWPCGGRHTAQRLQPLLFLTALPQQCGQTALTAATRLFSDTKMTLSRGRNSVFNWEGLNTNKMPPILLSCEKRRWSCHRKSQQCCCCGLSIISTQCTLLVPTCLGHTCNLLTAAGTSECSLGSAPPTVYLPQPAATLS